MWLAADAGGLLVLVPGHPVLNAIVSSSILYVLAHELAGAINAIVEGCAKRAAARWAMVGLLAATVLLAPVLLSP